MINTLEISDIKCQIYLTNEFPVGSLRDLCREGFNNFSPTRMQSTLNSDRLPNTSNAIVTFINTSYILHPKIQSCCQIPH